MCQRARDHREPPRCHGLGELRLQERGYCRKTGLDSGLSPRRAPEPPVAFILFFSFAEWAGAVVTLVLMFGLPLHNDISHHNSPQGRRRGGSQVEGTKRSGDGTPVEVCAGYADMWPAAGSSIGGFGGQGS